jgi:adenosylcobyric acid synthase
LVVIAGAGSPAEISLRDADLIVLPGSKSTLGDLAWMRERGLGEAVVAAGARAL